MTKLIIGAVAAFVFAAALGLWFIPVLRRLKFGQEIREEGPKWHAKKSGTPTMGGLIFISACFLSFLCFFVLNAFKIADFSLDIKTIMLLAISLVFGIIGFLDDYIKVILKRNLGLTAKQKFLLQLVAAIAFSGWAAYSGVVSTSIAVPFTEISFDMGMIFYIPFVTIVILATVNSVNLTDGLDGLATSVTIIVAMFYMFFASRMSNEYIALFAAVILGSLFGFLLYNKYPARVFMGDTGSLFLGGAVCGMAILLQEPIALLIVGFVYVMESLSVILQVASFKLFKKRIFKMSPIHHHFEMSGFSEVKIVILFTTITAVLCALMYFLG